MKNDKVMVKMEFVQSLVSKLLDDCNGVRCLSPKGEPGIMFSNAEDEARFMEGMREILTAFPEDSIIDR